MWIQGHDGYVKYEVENNLKSMGKIQLLRNWDN